MLADLITVRRIWSGCRSHCRPIGSGVSHSPAKAAALTYPTVSWGAIDPAFYLATVDTLPPLTRAVFMLQAHDLSYLETAYILGIDTDEVTFRFARALSAIVAALDSEYC